MSKRIKINVEVNAQNVLDADQIRAGIQAILDELGDDFTPFLANMAEPGVAHQWKTRIVGLVRNPLFKAFANKF